MNSQKYNKNELYPEDFSESDKLDFDIYLEQAKILFPKMSNDEWLIKMGIIAFIRKQKLGKTEPLTEQEIANIKNQYTNDTVFYTEPIKEENEAVEITLE
jgi:hypothetical protein